MGDTVQYRLEQMVDEIDDLEKKGIFTRLEINEIVKKRRNFEYKLKRPSPLKQDFLSFIEYEKQIDTLRRLRKRVVVRDLEEKGMGNKKIKRSVSDTSCVIRILRVFRLVTMRFKGDVGLWYQYLEFCRQHGHGRMKTVLAQVLRFHPNVPGLWMYAAGWEFDLNLNVASARNLMQRGLRACPNSEDLWVEYLRMELVYLNKLKARKSLLGEDKGLLTRDNKDSDDERWEDENKDLFMALDEGKTNADGSDEESENKLDVFRGHASKIIQTVYSGAVEALPSSMNLRKRFLELLGNLDLADSDNLREEILNGMRKDFAKFPEYWDWLSRLQIFDNMKTKKMTMEELHPELDKAVGIYEEALKYVPSAKMLSLYAKFWMDVISAEGDDSQISGSAPSSNFAVEFLSDLLKVYEKAESMGCMTEDLAYQYISLYLRVGRLEEARTMAGRLCDGKLSGAAKLWILRISIEMKWTTSKSSSLAKDDLRSTFELVRNALEKVSVSEADNLWHMVIKFFSNHKAYMDKLVNIFIACIAKDTEGGFSVSSALVNFTLQRDGIQRAREMYKRFLVLPHPSLALHRNCIELESNLAFIGDKDGLVNARKLYESALTTYSQDVGLWRDYYSLENKVGTSETANGVYWRARKSLKDSSRLIDPRDAC